jgi:hypothetical protein
MTRMEFHFDPARKKLFYRHISIKVSNIYVREIRPIEDLTRLTMRTRLEKKGCELQ